MLIKILKKTQFTLNLHGELYAFVSYTGSNTRAIY